MNSSSVTDEHLDFSIHLYIHFLSIHYDKYEGKSYD